MPLALKHDHSDVHSGQSVLWHQKLAMIFTEITDRQIDMHYLFPSTCKLPTQKLLRYMSIM